MRRRLMRRLPEFILGHKFATIPDPSDPKEDTYEGEHVPVEDINAAHIVLSVDDDGYHRPVLDIDFPAALIPSSTPGHYHLYLDKPMEWLKYKRLLVALAHAGILEEGYVGVSSARGYTSVRLPWVRKKAAA